MCGAWVVPLSPKTVALCIIFVVTRKKFIVPLQFTPATRKSLSPIRQEKFATSEGIEGSSSWKFYSVLIQEKLLAGKVIIQKVCHLGTFIVRKNLSSTQQENLCLQQGKFVIQENLSPTQQGKGNTSQENIISSRLKIKNFVVVACVYQLVVGRLKIFRLVTFSTKVR